MDLLALKDIMVQKEKRGKKATQGHQGHEGTLAQKDILAIKVTNQDPLGQKDQKGHEGTPALQVKNQDHQGQKDQRVIKEILALRAINQDHQGHQVHLDMMDQQAMMVHPAIKDTLDHLVQKDTLDHLAHPAHLIMVQNVIPSLKCIHVHSTGLMDMVLDVTGWKRETMK